MNSFPPPVDVAFAIDIHAHMFNGTDLQLKQFISLIGSLPFPPKVRKIAGLLVQVLTWLLAPIGCDEYK